MNVSQPGKIVSLSRKRLETSHVLVGAKQAGRTWAAQSVSRRLDVVGRFTDLLAAEARSIAATIDQRPVIDTLTSEILPLLEAGRYLQRNAARILRSRRHSQRAGFWLGRLGVTTLREPFGTVLIIGPSNYGLMLPGIQALQALVAGNAVLIKPAPGSSTALQRFASLLRRSGLDERLLTILDDSNETARELSRGLVDKVVFTGSREVGRTVLTDAAANLVPATGELSGWDACIVLDSAELQRAARAIAFALEFNGGRTCVAPRRIFVSEASHGELVALLVDALNRTRTVDFLPDVARKAAALTRDALDNGAVLAAGELSAGSIRGPVLLTGVSAEMAIFSSELFGPIALVTAVKDESEAITKANATPFGLGATVFGKDKGAIKVAEALDVGIVIINDAIAPAAHPAVTIAARRDSGFGATRGAEGLLEMTRPKTLVRNKTRRPLHFSQGSDRDIDLLDAYINSAFRRRWVTRLGAALSVIRAASGRSN